MAQILDEFAVPLKVLALRNSVFLPEAIVRTCEETDGWEHTWSGKQKSFCCATAGKAGLLQSSKLWSEEMLHEVPFSYGICQNLKDFLQDDVRHSFSHESAEAN